MLMLTIQQFDDPSIQEAVHSLIAHEMRTFTPQDYLAGLPHKELSFGSDLLKVYSEHDRSVFST